MRNPLSHEQNNAVVNGSGGTVGLIENPVAIRKWVVSGSEQARLLKEFEDNYLESKELECGYHHEEGFSSQKSFKEQVASLTAVISEMGNPFLEDTDELLALDTRNVLDVSVANSVREVCNLGKLQYSNYYKEVIIDRQRSIHDLIKKNSLPLLNSSKPKAKESGKISTLKNDVALFSRLYIVMQYRNSDMGAFFSHEYNSFPPSLANGGNLHLGKKSDLLTVLVQDT